MGNALVARLFYSLKTKNVPILFDAKLVELVKNKDRVEGAVVDIGDKRQTIRARRGVILATGGFAPKRKAARGVHARPAGGALECIRRRERRWVHGGANSRRGGG